MKFLKRPYTIRRYSAPVYVRGYSTIPYEDITLPMDVQTLEDATVTTPDGTESVQRLKVFCDYEIKVEDEGKQQKSDRLWYQGKWFDCKSSRLSENTPLRHYTATFVQCLKQDQGPGPGEEENVLSESLLHLLLWLIFRQIRINLINVRSTYAS